MLTDLFVKNGSSIGSVLQFVGQRGSHSKVDSASHCLSCRMHEPYSSGSFTRSA